MLPALVWICPDCRQIYEKEVAVCDRDGAPVARVRAHQTKARYPLLGKVIGERYHLIGGLGQGGVGTVYLARHRHLDQLVAVKFLDPDQDADLDEKARVGYRKDFLREAQVASVIRHDAVVRVSDFGEYDRVPFMVMEYVPGPSLLEMMARKGRFPFAEAIEIGRRIGEALDAFHERRLVHRDLKPANVILDPRGDGRLTLVDLGLVKDISGPAGRSSTHPLALRGTPGYLAPELVPAWVLAGAGVEGAEGKKSPDARVDLYALGVILYELLAGDSPYPAEGSNTEVIVWACTREPLPLSEVEPPIRLLPGLEELVLDTMAREPTRRPQTAAEFLSRLEQVAMGEAIRGSWPMMVVPDAGSRSRARRSGSAPHVSPDGRALSGGGDGAGASADGQRQGLLAPPPSPAPGTAGGAQDAAADLAEDESLGTDMMTRVNEVEPDSPALAPPTSELDTQSEGVDSFDVGGADDFADDSTMVSDVHEASTMPTTPEPAPVHARLGHARRGGEDRTRPLIMVAGVLAVVLAALVVWLTMSENDRGGRQIQQLEAEGPNAGSLTAGGATVAAGAAAAADASVPVAPVDAAPPPPVDAAAPPPPDAAPAVVAKPTPKRRPRRPKPRRPAPAALNLDAVLASGDTAYQARDFATALRHYERFLAETRANPTGFRRYAEIKDKVRVLRRTLDK
jgi:serine/threonine-protein kinase